MFHSIAVVLNVINTPNEAQSHTCKPIYQLHHQSGQCTPRIIVLVLRAIVPKGKLHTYEFNSIRVEKVWEDFKGHGLGHLVDVHHVDVCGKKELLELKNGDTVQFGGCSSCGCLCEEGIVRAKEWRYWRVKGGKTSNVVHHGMASSNGKTTYKTDLLNGNNNDDNNEEVNGKCGFQLPHTVVHAIFLDLPDH